MALTWTTRFFVIDVFFHACLLCTSVGGNWSDHHGVLNKHKGSPPAGVFLSSNVTLQGSLRGGMKLTCQVWEGTEIKWSIDNKTITNYDVEGLAVLEKVPFHLHSAMPGVAMVITVTKPSTSHEGLYYIESTLISDVMTLGHLFSVECVSDAGKKKVTANLTSVSLTTSSCLEEADKSECVQFNCQALDVDMLMWFLNGKETSTYSYSNNSEITFPIILSSKVPGVMVTIQNATTSTKKGYFSGLSSILKVKVNVPAASGLGQQYSVGCGDRYITNTTTMFGNNDSGSVRSSGNANKPSSVILTSNGTSLHGNECEEIIQFTCQIDSVKYMQWMFGVKQIARYNYEKADEEKCPVKVKLDDSSFSSLSVSITDIETKWFKGDLTSILTINADELVSHNIHNISCGSEEIFANKTIDLHRNCSDIPSLPIVPATYMYVNLSSNDTNGLHGNICPGVVEMTCAARNVPYMAWYFGGEDGEDPVVVKYSFKEGQHFPVQLCDEAKGNEIEDFCKHSGSITIDNVTRPGGGGDGGGGGGGGEGQDGDGGGSGGGEDVFDIHSTLVGDESYIYQKSIKSVQCGSNETRDTILTNFTVSCKLALDQRVILTSNQTSNGHVEVMCDGQDLSSLWWTYNNATSITKHYHFTPNTTLHITSLIAGMEVTIVTADQKDDMENNFNYRSRLSFDCERLSYINSVECGSEKIRQHFIVNCTTPNSSDGCTNSSFKAIIDYCSNNASQGCSLTWDGVEPKCYGIGGFLLLIIIIIIIIAIVISCKYFRSIKTEHRDDTKMQSISGFKCMEPEHKKRDDERQIQETKEQRDAERLARYTWEGQYYFVKKLKAMGSRLQKYWYEMNEKEAEDGERYLQTIAPCSKNCRISIKKSVTVKTINELFKVLEQHQSHLHIICGLKSKEGQIFIIQPFMESGSLRDMIYKETSPAKDWSDKYLGELGILPMETVKECGGHVLEAMHFLYKQGFPPLGHIHTGNIFKTGKGFVLGGYENTLLGYKTKLYRELAQGNHLDKIDVIMFGHVIYEMSSGHVLGGVVPTEEEYERVRYDKVKELLHFLFDMEVPGVSRVPNGVRKFLRLKIPRAHKKMMKKIKKHEFFQGIDEVKYDNVLTSEQTNLLAVVRGEKPPKALARGSRALANSGNETSINSNYSEVESPHLRNTPISGVESPYDGASLAGGPCNAESSCNSDAGTPRNGSCSSLIYQEHRDTSRLHHVCCC